MSKKKKDPDDPNEKVSQLSICLEVADTYMKERRISFTDTTGSFPRDAPPHL